MDTPLQSVLEWQGTSEKYCYQHMDVNKGDKYGNTPSYACSSGETQAKYLRSGKVDDVNKVNEWEHAAATAKARPF